MTTPELHLILTDPDGERLEVWAHPGDAHLHLVAIERATNRPAERVGYYLTEDNARQLRDAINARFPESTEAGPTPEAPTFDVGDRVEVFGWDVRKDGDPRSWDGPATVTQGLDGSPWISVKPDHLDVVGAFEPEYLRAYTDPTPDYVAMAAEFKPGDLAIVSDNPGTQAEPGSGYVAPEFKGRAVNVKSAGLTSELVGVALGNESFNYIHVAHLTKAKAVPA